LPSLHQSLRSLLSGGGESTGEKREKRSREERERMGRVKEAEGRAGTLRFTEVE